MIFTIIATQLLGGCTSLVPHNEGAIPLDNGITEYRNPTFENHIAWPGWLFISGVTAAGAWEGYNANIPLRWAGWRQQPQVQPIGNAALGALSGMASSLLLTLITGGSSPGVTADNAAKWLDKQDDRLILISPDTLHPGLTLNSIYGIARNADASYTIRTMQDARLFMTAFPESSHRDNVLAAAVGRLRRDSLPEFTQLVRSLPAERLAIDRYIAEIATLDEALALAPRFGAYRSAIEQRAAMLTLTFNDLRRFNRSFPESRFTEAIAQRLRDRLQRDEIPEFIALIPSLENQRELKLRYLNSFTTTLETIEAMRRYPDIRLEAERRAASLANSVTDYRAYLSGFPEGASVNEIKRLLHSALHPEQTDDDTTDQ